jgi:hypothetical protein
MSLLMGDVHNPILRRNSNKPKCRVRRTVFLGFCGLFFSSIPLASLEFSSSQNNNSSISTASIQALLMCFLSMCQTIFQLYKTK